MSSELRQIVESLHNPIADEIDAMLLKFFGSEEDLRRYIHLYVLEHEPVKMELMTHAELTGNSFMCQAITKIRIRPKTLAELEADQLD